MQEKYTVALAKGKKIWWKNWIVTNRFMIFGNGLIVELIQFYASFADWTIPAFS